MSKVNINFNDYKSSGVYFLEIDNSIIENIVATSGRLAVGFSKKGPFNAPVYIDNTSDLSAVYGEPDQKLERKGVFFNRHMSTLLKKSPFYALNLMPFEKVTERIGGMDESVWADYDKVEYLTIGSTPKTDDEKYSTGYPELYDKSRFWKPSTEYLNNLCVDTEGRHNPINIANVGTGDFTIIVRKAENLKGFDKTAREWYGTEADIPYSWIRPSDYMSDYFIQIICIEGKWNDPKLALDTYWKNYFELREEGEESVAVLKKDKFSKFIKLDPVRVLGDFTGCIIPDFYDGTGALQSIEPIVNQYTTKTGLLVSIDQVALEENAKEDIDMVGHCVENDTQCKFMSYDFNYGNVEYPLSDNVVIFDNTINFNYGYDEVDPSTGEPIDPAAVELASKLSVGAMVGSAFGDLSKVVKKQIFPDNEIDPSTGEPIYSEERPYKMTFTTTDILDNSSDELRIIPSIVSTYDVLIPMFVQGLDIDEKTKQLFNGKAWQDAGLAKWFYGEDAAIARIYHVLEDTGVHRSLMNNDVIDFRYVIDTMGHGLGSECGSKIYVSRLAKEKQHCSAIISAPSMTEFATTNLAAYYDEDDVYKTFDTKYIPMGGNDNLIKNEEFSVITEENGSKNTFIFAPYLKYRSNSKTILVPPAADVANAYMSKYDGADPYITVANMNGILSNGAINGIEYQYDQLDRDSLEPMGINPIIMRNGNVMIYGDRTSYQDVLSDYNYAHVREIINTIEIEAAAVLEGYVFRYNNAETRSEILQKLNPILKGMKDAGALYKYEIQMDENNNTDEVIDRSFAIIDIGVWITKNMEKVVARITVNKLSE